MNKSIQVEGFSNLDIHIHELSPHAISYNMHSTLELVTHGLPPKTKFFPYVLIKMINIFVSEWCLTRPEFVEGTCQVWAGAVNIESVEVSCDYGKSWTKATVQDLGEDLQ